MPRRRKDFRGLAETSRVRLLGEVQARPGSALRDLADRVGLHINSARDHLHALEDEGFVTARPRQTGTRGRPPMTYYPVNDPDMNATARKRVTRAQEHGDTLRRVLPETDRTAVLSQEAVHQLDALYEHLDDAGLSPTIIEENLEVDLVPCPYFRIVEEDRHLACAVHAAILRDTLAQVPGPLELEDLRPFTAPNSCEVLLRMAR